MSFKYITCPIPEIHAICIGYICSLLQEKRHASTYLLSNVTRGTVYWREWMGSCSHTRKENQYHLPLTFLAQSTHVV